MSDDNPLPGTVPDTVPGTVRTLTEDDLDALLAARKLTFLSDPNDPGLREMVKGRLELTRGHFLDGRLTSAAVTYPFDIYLAGTRVPMGGLAAVLSVPEFRRRGFVRQLLADTLTRLHDEGVGWSLEYPFDPYFYARYGWQSVPHGATLELPTERLFRGGSPDAYPIDIHPVDTYPVSPSDAERELAPLYETWAAQHNLAMVREGHPRPVWSRLSSDGESIYRLEDAYCVFGLEPTDHHLRLDVRDYAYTSPTGRTALRRFWGSFYGQATQVRLRLPDDDPWLFDFATFLQPSPHVLQARVVDVRAALAAFASPAAPSFVLDVRDDFCDWNDARFRVDTDGATLNVDDTPDTPDLSLDVRTLTLLLTGSLSAAAAVQAGLVAGETRHAETLAALSGGRTPFMSYGDYF
ncbi:MAG: GNAT family N-acetyltransferase [Trueperaceae bacterium]|nr:GNAT family N-acetyltransferase [Trueperaceae bacterium]